MVIAGLALVGCTATYSGAGRATSKTALAAEPGWVMTEVPELQQRELADCGPTALAMLAAHWGIDPEVARGAVVASSDATFAQLRTAARGLGLEAFVISGDVETVVHELELGRPILIGLLRPMGRKHARGHYEVIVGVHAERKLAATIDPAGGWKVRSFAELDQEWLPTKRAAMVVVGTTQHGRAPAHSDEPAPARAFKH